MLLRLALQGLVLLPKLFPLRPTYNFAVIVHSAAQTLKCCPQDKTLPPSAVHSDMLAPTAATSTCQASASFKKSQTSSMSNSRGATNWDGRHSCSLRCTSLLLASDDIHSSSRFQGALEEDCSETLPHSRAQIAHHRSQKSHRFTNFFHSGSLGAPWRRQRLAA